MTLIEFVARTFSPPLPDGRLIFRPWGAWGAWGPCYLLSARQRASRAWIQLAYYVLAISAICLYPAMIVSVQGILGLLVVFALGNYVVFWLFALGLPKTEAPPRLTPGERRTVMTEHARALGRPVLWLMLAISLLFVLGGLLPVAAVADPQEGLNQVSAGWSQAPARGGDPTARPNPAAACRSPSAGKRAPRRARPGAPRRCT